MIESSRDIIDLYFQAFENYVHSARMKLGCFRLDLEELEKEHERVAGSRRALRTRAAIVDDIAELRRDVEIMKAAFDDHSVYKEAYKATNLALPPYQVKHFQKLPETDIYERFLENYTKRFTWLNATSEQHNYSDHNDALERSKTERIKHFNSVLAELQLDTSQRYLSNHALMEADGLAEALECMPIRHPEITAKTLLVKRNEHSRLAGDEALSAWTTLLEDFAKSYTGHGIEEWRNARDEAFECHKVLVEHESLRPPLVDAVKSKGKVQQDWDAKYERLNEAYDHAFLKFKEIDDVRSEVGSVGMKTKALGEAEDRLRLVYPELHGIVEEQKKVAWRQANDERLARNESRDRDETERPASRKLER